MRTTAIMNLKGGTAKTVSAINLGAILSKIYGKRVLLIDADSQGNLSEFTLPDPKVLDKTPGTAALLQQQDANIVKTKMEGVWLMVGEPELMGLDISSASGGNVDTMAMADLMNALDETDRFDHCIIDCPPAFSAAAMAALAAADEVLIPVKLDAFGIRGLASLLQQIRNMKRINPDLEVAGVLPTMYYSTPTQKQAEEDLRSSLNALGIKCFHHIRRSPSVDGSTFAQSPLVYFSPKSGACRDYKLAVRELLGEGEEAEEDGV